MTNLDESLYAFFSYQRTNRLAGLKPVMQGFDSLGQFVPLALVSLFVIVALCAQRRYRSVLVMAATLTAGMLLILLLHTLIPRARPHEAHDLLPSDQWQKGFPSGPVLLSTVVYSLLATVLAGLVAKRVAGWAFYALAAPLIVLIALSQLFLGLNYATDVIAGLIGGLVLALIARRLAFTPAERTTSG